MFGEIISALAIVMVALIEAIAFRERKRAKDSREKMERRSEIRTKESRLSMQMMEASLDLAGAVALAIEHGRVNGELKEAKKKAAEAKAAYHDFIREAAAREVTKV